MENEKVNNQQPQQQPTDKDKAFDLAFGGPKKGYSALDQKINAKGNYVMDKNNANMRSYGSKGLYDFADGAEYGGLEKSYKDGGKYENGAILNSMGELTKPKNDQLNDRYNSTFDNKNDAKFDEEERNKINKAEAFGLAGVKNPNYRDIPYSKSSSYVPPYLTVKLKDGRVVPYDLEEGETVNQAIEALRDQIGDEIEDVYDLFTNSGSSSIWR